jgi:hypothetical protein
VAWQTKDFSEMLQEIKNLILSGNIRVSEHGYDQIAEHSLNVDEIIAGISDAVVVEEYPDYPKGKALLVLQKDSNGAFVHAVWGIPRGFEKPAVLITSYRPDPKLWDSAFRQRLKK